MEGLGSVSTQPLQHPELIWTQQIRESYQDYLLPEWVHVYSTFHSEISPPDHLLKWSSGTPSSAFRSSSDSHFSPKFCSSSVYEFSLMKCIEVSSPKANKKDVEIISSKVVKLFFDNFDLRRSNYFTHFFFHFSNPYAQSHQSENIPPQGAIKRPSHVHTNVLCRLLLWFQREPRKTFAEWVNFLPDMWIFKIQKENPWKNGSNTQTQAKDVKYSKENDQ